MYQWPEAVDASEEQKRREREEEAAKLKRQKELEKLGMFVCVYVCVYMYIYIYIYIYVYIHIHIYIHIHRYVCTHTYMKRRASRAFFYGTTSSRPQEEKRPRSETSLHGSARSSTKRRQVAEEQDTRAAGTPER
jgi:hypothetical protein